MNDRVIFGFFQGFFKLDNGPGKDILFIIDPSQGIGNIGVFRELLFGHLDQIEGLINFFPFFDITISQVIGRRGKLGIDL